MIAPSEMEEPDMDMNTEIKADHPTPKGDNGSVTNRCYTVQDLQTILGISRKTVYELLHRKEFRWIQIGNGRYRISKKSFDEWLDCAV